jgi:hypothetical protein
MTHPTTAQAPHRRKPSVPQPLKPNIIIAVALAVVSLIAGMAGYAYFEKMTVVDAFLNAAMILGGMGPVGTIGSTGGKVFAGLYALYSGLVVLITTGLILAPVLHNVLHRFHLGDDDDKG